MGYHDGPLQPGFEILEDSVPLRLFAFEGGATEPLSAPVSLSVKWL